MVGCVPKETHVTRRRSLRCESCWPQRQRPCGGHERALDDEGCGHGSPGTGNSLDTAVLNAGVLSGESDITKIGDERYDRMGANIDGVLRGMSEFLGAVGNAPEPVVVTISVGLVPAPHDAVYAMSKHAVIGLIRSLALNPSLGKIKINCICPNGVDTRRCWVRASSWAIATKLTSRRGSSSSSMTSSPAGLGSARRRSSNHSTCHRIRATASRRFSPRKPDSSGVPRTRSAR
jgi:NAD(P)-dependent dehydrogenase (short-subunit alcohol dehydrogenase family)